MSYDSKLEGMLALAIAMASGNASEGLETVQNTEQSRVRNSSRLPRDMRPSQAAFEALGFTFTDIGDSVLFEATLPEGWSTQETPGSQVFCGRTWLTIKVVYVVTTAIKEHSMIGMVI